RGVRLRRRDRQLDVAAARTRADRAGRHHHHEVRRRGRRADPALNVEVDGATLAVSVTLPEGGGQAPGIVALHGAAYGTRDFVVYEHLHRVLPPAGFAVATFDRRGNGESTGEPSRGRFDVQSGDALAVLGALGELPEVDASRLGLWAFSQGAWVAPLAATRSDAVRFLALVASTGVTPGEQMVFAASCQ